MYIGITAFGRTSYRILSIRGLEEPTKTQTTAVPMALTWGGLDLSCPKCGVEGAECEECGFVHCPCGHDFLPVHVRHVNFGE